MYNLVLECLHYNNVNSIALKKKFPALSLFLSYALIFFLLILSTIFVHNILIKPVNIIDYLEVLYSDINESLQVPEINTTWALLAWTPPACEPGEDANQPAARFENIKPIADTDLEYEVSFANFFPINFLVFFAHIWQIFANISLIIYEHLVDF